MKLTTLHKAAFISAGISVGALSIAVPAMMSGSQCQKLSDTTSIEACVKVGQQSWYSWFQGKSRSTQFHFVDLLELLSRLSPAQQP